MDNKREIKAKRLAQLVAEHRERRLAVGRALHWPGAIRQGSVDLLAEGISNAKLSELTGLSSETLRIWRRGSKDKHSGPAGFSELQVVAVSEGLQGHSQNSSNAEIALRSSRGHVVIGLQVQHIAAFLQAGLL